VDYLERAYYDPWDFSFSGEPFTPTPADAGATPAKTSAPNNTSSSRAGAALAAVPTEAYAAAFAVAVTVATPYILNRISRWSLGRAKKAREERERAARSQA
jgi:ABC-type branched-subunit amino acid transport system permease subunit